MSLILLFLTFRGPTLGKVGVEFAKVSRNGTEQPPIKKQRVSVTEAIGKHGRGKIPCFALSTILDPKMLQWCDFSGNFLISRNFARTVLFSGNSALYKIIEKHIPLEKFKTFQEISTIPNHICEASVFFVVCD